MPKILIVEDDGDVQDRYEAKLPNFELVQAETWDDGLRLFQEHADSLDAVVLDGNLNGVEGWTLAEKIREAGYKGPMIAASSASDYRQNLLGSGCDHSVNWKSDVPSLLRKLFP